MIAEGSKDVGEVLRKCLDFGDRRYPLGEGCLGEGGHHTFVGRGESGRRESICNNKIPEEALG